MATTSTQASGNNFAILISLLIVGIVVVAMVLLEGKSTPYAVPVRDFSPQERRHFRLEGTVTRMDSGTTLCDGDRCVPLAVPPTESVRPGDRVIVEGQWMEGMMHVSRALRRCDHPQ